MAEQARRIFISLSHTEVSAVDAGAPNVTLKSLQEWMVTNPCPDGMLGDQVHMIVARYGYRALAGAEDRMALDESQKAELNERRKLGDDLVALLAEVEQVSNGHSDGRHEQPLIESP